MFTLKINTANDAFIDEKRAIADMLEEVAERLRHDVSPADDRIGCVIRDYNGNTVGKWELR